MKCLFALVATGLIILASLPAVTAFPRLSMHLVATRAETSRAFPGLSSRAPDLPVKTIGLLWTREFGTPVYDEARGVAANGSGVFVAGTTRGAFPGQTNAGDADAYLRKYDRSGAELWTRQFGTSGSEEAYATAVNGSVVYVAGITNGTLPGQTNAGAIDAFVRKYDAAGTELWTRQFGTSANDVAFAASVDSSAVYVAGYTEGTLPGQTTVGGAFVRKYDPAGAEVWTRQFNASGGSISAWGVASDGSNVYVAGQTDGTLPGQTKSGVWDAFVRKYNAAGTELWTRQFGTSGSLLTWADAADASGVYVAGEGFVRKYDASGLEVWTQWFSATVYAAAADSSGVYVAGWAIGALPGSVGTGHVFVRKYDMFGRQGWTFQFGTTGSTEAHAVAIDSTQLYVAGRTNGAFPGQMNSGDFDAFLTGFGEAKVPLSPSITQAAPGDTTVALAWSAPTFDGGTPITNYTIYRGTSVATLVLLTTVGQALTYPDTAVTNGVTYYYQVSAVNAVGEGPRSNEASSTPVGRPSAPLSLRARGGDGNVTLTWQTPSSDGGYAISYYRVYQGMSSSVLSPRAVVASSTLSYTDASLTNGLTFYYQTTAVNALGEGPRSREVSATPVRPDTTPPTIEIIAPLQGAILSSSAVRVTGTASDDVAVEQVEVSLDGTTWVLATGTTLWSIPLTLREGSNTITARATDASGNAVSTTVVVTVVGALILFGSVAGAGIVLVAAIYLLRRRKRRGAEPPPGATPPVA